METTKEFSSFGLDPKLLDSLTKNGFINASPVQELTIEPILDGQDIFAQAETGSGKTGSFAIPMIEQILRTQIDKKNVPSYLVLSPTRELAQQTHKVFNLFGKDLGIASVCLIGGEDIEKQKKRLSDGVHVLVATPGRMRDLIEQKATDISEVKGVVFDEADRLFDMGFKKDIEFILKKAPEGRQLIMVSATSNLDVLNTAYRFKSEPLELKLNEDSLLVDHINHQIAMVSRNEKMPLLVKTLRDAEDAYAIVFCNTQFQTHSVAEWLKAMGFKAKPISGRMAQNKRTRLMEEFRNKEVTILVCTDVAARGLDIKDINLVVNYDLPQEAANYVHRIGRTGRAGKKGRAISFCAYEDCENLDGITKLIEGKIPKMDLKNDDFATDLCRKPYIDAKTLRVVERNQNHQSNKTKDRSKTASSNKKPSNTQTQTQNLKRSNEKRTKDIDANNLKKRPEGEKKMARKVDRRFFEVVSTNKNQSDKEAMNFFSLNDEQLLGWEVLEKGRKKFIFFGSAKTKYKYFIKPIYKKLLLPFLIELIRKADLNLYVKVNYKNSSLWVNFSGKDEKMLTKNNNELLFAFDQIIRVYLSSKVKLPRGLKIEVKCQNGSTNKEDHLIKLVDKMTKKVEETGEPVTLKPLSPSERRIVHQYLSEGDNFKSESIGDGRFKKMEISFR